MAYKLQVVDNTNGLNFNVKYENLGKYEKPEVIAKAPNGDIVKQRTTYLGQVLPQGSTNRQWCDDKGTVYQKEQLKFYDDQGNEVHENSQSKTFTVEGYSPLKNYTDVYVISTYYELFPHNNDMKKDWDKEVARVTNLTGMKKLWDYLDQNQVVARGEFCASSIGFGESYGYLRAVKFGNKWCLELGVFKQEKIFQHLQETIPAIPTQTQGTRKMVLK